MICRASKVMFLILPLAVIGLFLSCTSVKPKKSPNSSKSTSGSTYPQASREALPEPEFIADGHQQIRPPNPTTFQMALNPTSNPIGGGPGYKPIMDQKQADYVVNDKATLKSSLLNAKRGQIIFISGDAIIDLSGEKLVIPAGVTLASDRGNGDNPGALLFSNTMYPEASVDSYQDYLFATGGPKVRIVGLRLRGPSAEINEHSTYVACGIKGMYGELEVANCELSHWLKWAIDLAVAYGDNIHHNYIHHTRRTGFGYGIWVRGSGKDYAPEPNAIPVIEANILENCRHEIGAGAQETSSYIARHNIISRHAMSNHLIDRHQQGYYTEVSNNVIAPANHLIFHGMTMAPLDALVFTGNWCDEKDIKRVFPNHNKTGWNIKFHDNELGGVWRKHQPRVNITADIGEEFAPTTITFNATASDPDGYPIDAFIWDVDDGRIMRMSKSGRMRMVFEEPGVYTVRVRARNSYGLLSEPASINVHFMEKPLDIPISRNLVAFWDFNEESQWYADFLGRYNLQVVEPLPNVAEGIEGLAIERDADPKDLVQNPHVGNTFARALQPGTEDFSFCLAFKLTQLPAPNSYVGLLGYGAGSEFESGYNLTFRNSEPSELSFFISNGRGKRDRVVIKTGIIVGKWYHVVVSVDRKYSLKAYFDGEEIVSSKLSVGADDIYHDYHDYGVLSRFVQYPQAVIDQVGCWDRTLNPEEVIWLYNKGNGRNRSEF